MFYKAIQNRNVVGPGQRSRFLLLTKRSAASGDENAASFAFYYLSWLRLFLVVYFFFYFAHQSAFILLEWYKIDAKGIMATNSERKKPHKHARGLAARQAPSVNFVVLANNILRNK